MDWMIHFDWLHHLIARLLPLALAVLLLACAAALIEAGLALGERWRGLRLLELGGDADRVERLARRRIERCDLLARVPPMLGLMATIIPLGPGLAALGQGDPAKLAAAVTVAFDATVLGLIAGIAGLWIGRLRRRWYEELLERMDAAA
ncbi:MotA/TolQ/ExbB proton channel family protein [Lysobacter sp. K5869]|uniref:MotA/TolQ/ExbB proton channel family protein n=1 Tax=Lysobacter sp. K5869 TaxID=2820808 RepID=UPI001C06480D|nr:MotA/TolQ/ExbB proton channel family protein [Lysobacter sp. K5869]QWP76311.1 MotA/TolQ/ExbB proton channel family protein [Lysobacter sp. K5869]